MFTEPRRPLLLLLLFGFLGFGLILLPDYGISWDEAMSRHNGMVSLKYVLDTLGVDWLADDPYLGGIPATLHEWHDRDYGVAFDLVAGFLERSVGLVDTRHVFLFRHALTFFASAAGLVAVYLIARRRHATAWAGLAAAVLLVTSPRQFAESFYNGKDIVLMAVVAIAIASHLRVLQRPTLAAILGHAAITAVALNIRVVALGVVALTIATLLAGMALSKRQRGAFGLALLVYPIVTAALTIAMWPYLWEDPWAHFATTVSNMVEFRWPGSMLFEGEVILATELPRHYLPVWILQTTPPHVLVLFALGLAAIARDAGRFLAGPRLDSAVLAQDLVLAGYFFGPVLGVIAFGSIVYDGWRHLYFAYPAMICIAAGGLVWARHELTTRPRWQLAFLAMVAASVLVTIGWMVRAHPHEYVYFNGLASKPWVGHYDTDYWGVTGVDALRIGLADSDKAFVTFWPASAMNLSLSAEMLPAEERARAFVSATRDNVDYVITNYREHWGRSPDVLDGLTLVDHIWAGGEIICSVYRNDRPGAAEGPR